MGLLRRLYRLPLLIVLLVLGLLGLVLVQPWLPMGGRRAMVRGWSRALLGVCGVAVHEEWGGQGTVSGGESGGENSRPVSGHADGPAVATSPAQKPAIAVTQPLATLAALAPGRMIVANHVSWLDVFAINSRATSAFVAKAEIREWPVVGWLVSLAGTVYIRRGDTKAVPDVIVQMQERLRTGFPVALFPEATTHVGPTLRKFHGKLLQAAIDEQADILPVGLQYRYADGTPAEVAWYVGDTTFVQSFWQVLGASGIGVRMVVMAPLGTVGEEKGALAARARERVCVGLGVAVSQEG